MINPTIRTLAFALLAACTTIGAAYYYPWPEAVSQSERVGSALFEDFEANKVRRIRIQRYNTSTGKLEQIEVRRKGDAWVLPGFKNFPASNLAQTTITPNSMVERLVLEETTDKAEDHRQYGVVDPALYESMPNRSALGTKLVLEGATNNVLANLIIGSPVKEAGLNENGEQKRYVNIPGQPTVYVIDFDPRAIATEFRAWVDPNLFNLPRESDVRVIEIENVRLDQDSMDPNKPENLYRVGVTPQLVGDGQFQLKVVELEMPDGDGKLVAAQLPEQAPEALLRIGAQLNRVFFGDVRKLASGLANVLKGDQPDSAALAGLKKFGIVSTGASQDSLTFDSSAGEVRLKFKDGVTVAMLIGNIATDATDQNELSRYVMFRAGFDESQVEPAPSKPEPNDDPEEADRQNKEYLRKVKARDEAIAAARQFVDGYNAKNGGWIFLVPDSIVSILRPDLDLSATKPAQTSAAEPESGDDSQESR